jgi:parvulin-like peptidyl-prolyl isomerase
MFVLVLQEVDAQGLKDPERAVAKVGPDVITVKEFIERYEFLPWPQRHKKNSTEALKIEFLYALIAEKLLAAEGLSQGLTQHPAYSQKTRDVETKFVRDALYRDEVVQRVRVVDSELWEAYKKSKLAFFIKALQFRSSKEADFVSRLIESGTPFEAIASDTSISVENEETRNDTLAVRYGDYVTQVEDTLFRLKVGQVTSPIHVDDHYYVIKLERKETEPILSQEEFNQRKEQLEQTIRRRKEQTRAEDFLHQFLVGTTGSVKSGSMKSVLLELQKVFSRAQGNSLESSVGLTMDDYAEMTKDLASVWNDSLLTANDSTWTVGQFIGLLIAENLSVPDGSARSVKRAVDGVITMIIRQSYLVKESYRRKLQFDPGVKEDMKMWREYVLANLVKDQIRDTIGVSESEVNEYYRRHQLESETPVELNIREILLDNLQDVKEVMSRLDSGEKFAELAKRYSKRSWAAKKGGEFGFAQVSALGDIGTVASKMKVGERFGPIQVGEGYSVFELIGKRTDPSYIPAEDSIKQEIRKTLLQSKQKKAVSSMVGKLARKFDISIDEELLKSLKVSSIPMMTYRFLGFGGRIVAVPFVERLLDWVQEWKPEFVPLP